MILAGRGFGKTKTSAEDCWYYAYHHPDERIAVVAPTSKDLRETMMEGASGILRAIPQELISGYNRSFCELKLTNGAQINGYSAEEPERLRGPNFHRAYVDELASWNNISSFDMLNFALRIGENPRCIITTTPKPTNIIRNLVSDAHKVPESFTDEAASLIEPLSTPIHAMKLASLGSKDLSGKTVVILGCGTIGLLTLVAAKYFNAKMIVMTDLLPNKRERALRLGADAVLDAGLAGVVDDVRALLGDSADVVFDCVALQPTVNQAISLADKGGTVVIVGVPEKDVSVPLPIIQDHQIRIQGSATYLPSDFKDAITLLGSGALDVKEFVTAVFPWEETQEAFESALLGDQVKVLIRFS